MGCRRVRTREGMNLRPRSSIGRRAKIKHIKRVRRAKCTALPGVWLSQEGPCRATESISTGMPPRRFAPKRARNGVGSDAIGNPSSVHCGKPRGAESRGRRARNCREGCRRAIAKRDFTSGGTEANALALAPGLHRRNGALVKHLTVSAIEHPSVLAGGRFLSGAIAQTPVTQQGIVDLDALQSMFSDDGPALVSVMLANNETGAIQPIAEISELVHAAGGVLHVDAIQAFGKIPIDLSALGADCITLSAHKLGDRKALALVFTDELQGLNASFAAAVRSRDVARERRTSPELQASVLP